MVEAYSATSAALIALMGWGVHDVSAFIKTHPQIREPSDLDAFKSLARRNMIAALVGFTLIAAWFVLAIAVSKELHWGLKAVTWAVLAPVYLLGSRVKRVETQARDLPCESGMEAEYRRVGESWQHKALPDF
jgi:hypothetical protein